MMHLLSLFLALTLISSIVHSKEVWDLYALSGDGVSEYKNSTCYSKSFFYENIAPLDGEMAWDSKSNPELKTSISLIGEVDGIDYFDVIQQYKGQKQIKIIAFANNDELLCPFYAWQPISGFVNKMKSELVSVSGNSYIGHSLEIYRSRYSEYFVIFNGLPLRLNIVELSNEYIAKNHPEHYIRNSVLNINNLAYTVKLANKKDSNCCPTGKSLNLYFEVKNGITKLIKVEDSILQ